MAALRCTAARHQRTAFPRDVSFSIALGLLFAVLALSTPAASVSVNVMEYGNNDVIVNSLDTGFKVLMLIGTSPSMFDARAFVVGAFPLYAAADSAITSMDKVIMVNWCAATEGHLNDTMSCPEGRSYNDYTYYSSVFVQMSFPSWNGSTVPSPVNVKLDSLKVISQIAVSSFAGIHNPDGDGSSKGPMFIIDITNENVAAYAVFGVLVSVVAIALIITCVCICKHDNAMADASKSVIDNAIEKLRSKRHLSRKGDATVTNLSDHYNINMDVAVVEPPLPPTTQASATAGLNPRESNGTSAVPPASRTADEQEMREIKAQQV
ncbi:hypothetical protein ABL78_1855 [Leptomonas seymouri]|uniref:Membrane-associated protein n=1 Tax=Leptomonas seymouri TaxID=5684 RepID=A0A0N1IM62_LEPSE|nr:hypothetical protein ABL78_1855 [Leptomonas seymouri]|eukprot:KPI89042.1 hypothetical protein ABL78_1855 [Leptomonas seymouri]